VPGRDGIEAGRQGTSLAPKDSTTSCQLPTIRISLLELLRVLQRQERDGAVYACVRDSFELSMCHAERNISASK
jgi:hypothetical protein